MIFDEFFCVCLPGSNTADATDIVTSPVMAGGVLSSPPGSMVSSPPMDEMMVGLESGEPLPPMMSVGSSPGEPSPALVHSPSLEAGHIMLSLAEPHRQPPGTATELLCSAAAAARAGQEVGGSLAHMVSLSTPPTDQRGATLLQPMLGQAEEPNTIVVANSHIFKQEVI